MKNKAILAIGITALFIGMAVIPGTAEQKSVDTNNADSAIKSTGCPNFGRINADGALNDDGFILPYRLLGVNFNAYMIFSACTIKVNGDTYIRQAPGAIHMDLFIGLHSISPIPYRGSLSGWGFGIRIS
jgi:hypothetical protein